jgi:hypothetical protein
MECYGYRRHVRVVAKWRGKCRDAGRRRTAPQAMRSVLPKFAVGLRLGLWAYGTKRTRAHERQNMSQSLLPGAVEPLLRPKLGDGLGELHLGGLVLEELTVRSAVQEIVLEHRWRYGYSITARTVRANG